MGLFTQFCRWIGLRAVYSTNHSQNIERANERINQILHEERCIKEQIYFEILYVSAFSSLASEGLQNCFPGVKFRAKFAVVLQKQFLKVIAKHSTQF